MASTTGWMTSVLNQSNQAVNTSTEKANEAKASADASQVSAVNSANSATDAANNWAMIQAWSKNFNSHFLGTYEEDPTTDPDGNPLIDQAEYYNSKTKHVRVYTLSTKSWADQDESVEVEMQAAQVSAANAASSEASASASNSAAQAANNAAQAAMTSVNQSMFWMNTWWLGPKDGAPTQDLNGKALQPGNTYYDLSLNKLRTWNGSDWFTVATSDDVSYIENNFVKIDGSNSMTGTLNIKYSGWIGSNLIGFTTSDNSWYASPAYVASISGPLSATSTFRTSYTKTNNSTYLDLSHASTQTSKPGCTLFLWDDGRTTTSGDIIVGDSDKGSHSVYAVGFNSTSADMAENYKSEIDYPVGTVVSVSYSSNPNQEICEAETRDRVLGVISTEPGLLINSAIDEELAHPVGLVGRVPTRVYGEARKGDPVYLSIHPGIATCDTYIAENNSPIGFALENSESEGESLIEVALKI